jgi:hypothetical protein
LMMSSVRNFVITAALAGTAGCGLWENPRTCYPGSESYQLKQATRFDPYPDPTTGPPIVGGRPIEYMSPRPEPDVTKTLPRVSAVSAPPPASPYQLPNVSLPPPISYNPPPGATYAGTAPATISPSSPRPLVPINSPVQPAIATVPLSSTSPAATAVTPTAYGTAVRDP